MADWDPLANEIFTRAIEAGSSAERAAILDRSCRDDADLRRRVQALLVAHDAAGSFLDRPAPGLAAVRAEGVPAFEAGPANTPGDRPEAVGTSAEGTGAFVAGSAPADAATRPTAEGPGTRIGPYKLLQQIGEGGMGVVYMAEQETPVRRKVALKIIKPGMDTGQIVARFEAERQALAMMDHPHIARVLDAGATETGRPFFVMELVKGVPITEYCDQAQLTPRERLELFVPICRAIQHAHQKGIIHRDVKASNVMVTLLDGRPTPKVIDFGVAKATGQRLTERSLFTQYGAIVGTLEYMSPEQAEMSGLDVDTRSDIFSLGVLLYELLTGTTPLERARLREAGFAEILRRIREEEPPRPSTRLSGSGEALATIAARRHTEPARLTRLVRGELDWIVMKALEKDRTRRYETAAGFARDVERYLSDEAVEACPPSRRYRLGKFVRKHRAALATAGAFAFVLIAATAVSGYLAFWANRAEGKAKKALNDSAAALERAERSADRARAVSNFMVEAFRRPNPDQDGRDLKVVDLLDAAEARLGSQFAGSPEIHGALLQALGATYIGLGLDPRAVDVLTRALTLLKGSQGPDHLDTLACRNLLAQAYTNTGRIAEAISLYEEGIELSKGRLAPEHRDMLATRSNLAVAYSEAGRLAEAIALQEEIVELIAARLGPDDPLMMNARVNLGDFYRRAGRNAEAITVLEELLKVRAARSGPDHQDTLMVQNNLAGAYEAAGRTAESIPIQEKVLERWMADLGLDHRRTLAARNNLVASYLRVGRVSQSIALQEETVKRVMTKYGPDHPMTITSRNNLAACYGYGGRRDEAIRLFREVIPAASKAWGPGHPNTLRSMGRLAGLLEQAGNWDEATSLRRETLRCRREAAPPESPELAADLAALGRNRVERAEWAEAEPLLRESVKISEGKQPDSWATFHARSLLGACLAGRRELAEAEPLIVSGYEGLKAHEGQIPQPERTILGDASARVVRLYEAWGKPEKAEEWKEKLGKEVKPGSPIRP